MNVSQVCQTWRSLSLSTPSLWTNIIIIVPDRPLSHEDCMQIKRRIRLADLWMLRSQPLRTTLRVQVGASLGDELDLAIHELTLFIHTHQDRWREASLKFRYGLRSPLVAMGEVSHLEELEYRNGNVRDQDSLPVVPIDASNLPDLESLVLNGRCVLTYSVTTSRLRALRTVHLDVFTTSHDCLLLLQVAPSLESLALCLRRRDDLECPALTHWNLKILDFSFQSTDEAVKMVNKLTLPKLHSLSLNPCSGDEYLLDVVLAVNTLLERSRVSLREYEYGFDDDESLLDYLQHLPQLTSLSLLFSHGYDDGFSAIFNALTLRGDGEQEENALSSLCPRLDALSLMSGSKKVKIRKLAEMLTSRWIPNDAGRGGSRGHSLQKFICSTDIYKKLMRLQIIQTCVAEGLEISDGEIEPPERSWHWAAYSY